MNARKKPLEVTDLVRWLIVLSLWISLPATVGCELGSRRPPPEGQLAIENVAKWYQLYRADNRGQAPSDEDAFIEFVEAKLQERGDTIDREQFLTSPRDGKKYVVNYGKRKSRSMGNMDQIVAVYEQEGYGDKKLVAFEAAWSKEVDESELQSLLAPQE